jgi:hypothetical protein
MSLHGGCESRTVPVGNVFVGNAGGDVEHDDSALPVNVVSITETTKLLLTSSIPYVKLNATQVLRSRKHSLIT